MWYYEEKFIIYKKIEKYLVKTSCRSLILPKKHQSEVDKFWQTVKEGSHFTMIFKFCMQLLNYRRALWISKIISIFWKNWGFAPSPLFPHFFLNLYLLFDFDEILYATSLLLKNRTKLNIFTNGGPPPNSLKC